METLKGGNEMSNKNYRNYYKEQKQESETVIEPTEENSVDSEPVDNIMESETNNVVVKDDDQEPTKTEIGKVNCIRLKIRNKPSIGGSIVCLARVGDELTIDRSKYYDGWLKVTTVDGLEGFCRQDFVTVI